MDLLSEKKIASSEVKQFKLKRFEGNPILSPIPESSWQSLVTTNPGAWYDENLQKVFILYRAAGNDEEHRVRLGLAVSEDGYHFRRATETPVFDVSVDGFDAGCIEDPRMVKMGDYYYITYAARAFVPGQYWLPPDRRRKPVECPETFPACLKSNLTVSGLAITKNFENFIRAGRLTDPLVDDRDVILFPEKINGNYVMLHRPMDVEENCIAGGKHPTMWISKSEDLLKWENSKPLIRPKFDWECKIGGSTPPIKTAVGWLTLYHAVDPQKRYHVGAMLLDLEDPCNVLYRLPSSLLEPEEAYETDGLYNGVVFPCGNVVIDETLFVYYGGADRYCCLATCNLQKLLDYLQSYPA